MREAYDAIRFPLCYIPTEKVLRMVGMDLQHLFLFLISMIPRMLCIVLRSPCLALIG